MRTKELIYGKGILYILRAMSVVMILLSVQNQRYRN
jgi:hypothetical protein